MVLFITLYKVVLKFMTYTRVITIFLFFLNNKIVGCCGSHIISKREFHLVLSSMYMHTPTVFLFTSVDRVSLTALMCSRKFTASHVRVAYMRTCPGGDLITLLWDIMNALMTLLSLNYHKTTSYLLGEKECSRYGSKSNLHDGTSRGC